ncbi:oxidoreductase [Streptomyces boninensis]|uniref:oxidoreductase n=1 Tax=Streptomyces boninensis TaxID=2039455 RepID=UPI003B219E13
MATKTKQHKIGSGFGERSTAADVTAGIDLSGRLAVVTGGHAGLGLETTRALAGAGARVVVAARQVAAAVAGLAGVEVEQLDLADLANVRAFADRFLATGRGIDMLVNSAGVMATPLTRVGPGGWEQQFAVNHLGHYALTNLLWPALARTGAARVVAVSSAGHHGSGIRWHDPHFTSDPYDKWLAYAQSKTANSLFAVHLDRLGEPSGVRAFALHPGKILTGLVRHLAPSEMTEAGWTDPAGNVIDPTFKTPEQGAATQVWAATSPQLDGMGGVYLEDCDVADLSTDTGIEPGVSPHAIDPAEAERLWTLSAQLSGTDAFAA